MSDPIKLMLRNPETIPDNSLIFLDYRDLLEIFTRRRLEIVNIISRSKPASLQELVKKTKRKKQAINRDLRILERHEVIKLVKQGRKVIPRINKEIILFQIPRSSTESNHGRIKSYEAV